MSTPSNESNKRQRSENSLDYTPAATAPSLCLGNVVTYYEPLKVCLDDDSSLEEDEEFDDDDFCFSNEHSESMAVVTDEGSSQCSLCSVSNSLSTPSLCSSGNLTHLSHDSLTTSYGSKRGRPKRRVILDNDVEVIPIPTRSEYSDPVKERLWSSASELDQNAARNRTEFIFEGWNWRTVVEDEKMLVCLKSGELIHPIWICQQNCNQNRRIDGDTTRHLTSVAPCNVDKEIASS